MNASSASHRVLSYQASRKLAAWLAPVSLLFAANACASKPAPPEEPAKPSAERIGVYDSRSIAIAWVGTEPFTQSMNALRKEAEQAKAAGDRERAAALERTGVATQQRLHLQGFSTEPVDDILAHFQDQVAAVRVKSGVAALVSKWDEASLAAHPGAERVDVTAQLVEAMHPNDRQRETALGIVKSKPISLAEARRIPADK